MSTPPEIAIEIPPSPRAASVVLDRYGCAWQRIGRFWNRAGGTFAFGLNSPDQQEWADLLVHRGPLRVIWVPPEKTP